MHVYVTHLRFADEHECTGEILHARSRTHAHTYDGLIDGEFKSVKPLHGSIRGMERQQLKDHRFNV